MRQAVNRGLFTVLVSALLGMSAHAAVIYTEDFDTDHTSNWKVNKSTGANANDAASNANFFFDYSSKGIPSAPGSAGSSTRGLMMEANIAGAGSAITSGLSVSPLVSPFGANFTDDFTITFYAWLNTIGPMPDGGSGSTQITNWGWGTSGTIAQWMTGTQESVHFGTTAEGGASLDYRAYSSASGPGNGYAPASNVFAAGTGTSPDARNDQHPYYAGVGNKTPPVDQATLFPTQTGATTTGSTGFAWRKMIIKKQGGALSWTMVINDDQNLPIATVPLSGLTLGGSNILFGQYDINSSKSTETNHLIFGLIDNVVIEAIVAGPMITQQPMNQNKIVDETAVFTAKAKSNYPNLPVVHFEWFKTFNLQTTSQGPGAVTGPDDSGVYTSTLTFSGVQYNESGAQYYVVVTDDRPPPASPVTSNKVYLTVLPVPCHDPFADVDGDAQSDVDQLDFGTLQTCYTGSVPGLIDFAHCGCFDRDRDGDIDSFDVSRFIACASGPAIPANIACDDYPTGTVVINEIAYDMFTIGGAEAIDDREFVELYNPSGVAVDISGWQLRSSDTVAPFPGPTGDDNPDYTIPGAPGSGTTMLASHAYYVLGAQGVANLNQQLGTTDLFENGNEAVQLLDANGTVIDTFVYELNAGPVAIGPAEGGYWGNNVFIVNTNMSISRYVDGRDTNDNGRDFGVLPQTPGASNSGSLSVMTAYIPPNVDGATPGDPVAGLIGSFVDATVINPADITLLKGTDDVNPNVIPNSPQGGNCIVAWDPSGGGNATYSTGLMTGNGSYDLYVYLDTADITEPGAETTSYGIMGSTDPLYNQPDPDGNFFGDIVTSNGNTGLAWVYNKNNAGQNKKLFLVDAGHGGDSSGDVGATTPRSWAIVQTINMTGMASGWHRLSIAYTGATGAVVAKYDTQTFNFSTTANLVGQFYIGYRESLAATPASLRPPTFDRVGP